MDRKFQESRDSMRVERGSSSASHFSAGLKGLGMGMIGGLTSMITQPIEGASKKGVSVSMVAIILCTTKIRLLDVTFCLIKSLQDVKLTHDEGRQGFFGTRDSLLF